MTPTPRPPQSFRVDDPDLVMPDIPAPTQSADAAPPQKEAPITLPGLADIGRGARWGAMLIAAMLALAGLAASLWFARFVSVAIGRDDWIGWFAVGLLTIIAACAAMLALREVFGLLRLSRLGRLRRAVDAALTTKDLAAERSAVIALERLYAGRADMRWGLDRLAEHRGDVRDPGELLAIADRELMAPIDAEARRRVLASAKRVMTATALSPVMVLSVGFVLYENMRLLRAIGALYGGRPGALGGLRLARHVATHLVATGSVALTDDLLGQFLGQDLLRRVSRRLGEGAFNGALTVRVGAAAIEVVRPLPFIAAPPVRVRDIVGELLRRSPQP